MKMTWTITLISKGWEAETEEQAREIFLSEIDIDLNSGDWIKVEKEAD